MKELYIEEGCDIKREIYLSLLPDRSTSRLTFIVSGEGGIDIEELAVNAPEKILKVAIDPVTGIQPFHVREISFFLGLAGATAKQFGKVLAGLYKAFNDLDAELIEINPLAINSSDDVILLDAKITLDDSALFRHKDLAELRDKSEEDPVEAEAEKHSLNYVQLSGNIGCMVNGAGLAMATMDIIKYSGGEPANFLDIGGGATKERIQTAIKIITTDADVKAILINIFGGIIRCDMVAEQIVAVVKEINLQTPMVIRLEGNNAEKGLKILADSGLQLIPAQGLADAGRKAVEAASGNSQ